MRIKAARARWLRACVRPVVSRDADTQPPGLKPIEESINRSKNRPTDRRIDQPIEESSITDRRIDQPIEESTNRSKNRRSDRSERQTTTWIAFLVGDQIAITSLGPPFGEKSMRIRHPLGSKSHVPGRATSATSTHSGPVGSRAYDTTATLSDSEKTSLCAPRQRRALYPGVRNCSP